MRLVVRENPQEPSHVLRRDIEVRNPLGGVNIPSNGAVECCFVEVMPRAQVEERTMGHVARLGYKFDGSVPQC